MPGSSRADLQSKVTLLTTFLPRPARLAAASALALIAAPALADVNLPAPYVSRALDAVLLPIDTDVRSAFDLAADDAGVLVLATEPDGVADANGVVPGDVIQMIGGQKVVNPIEVDEIVYYWILEGIFDFDLGVYRDGGYVEVVSTISEESYWEEIEVTTVETWSSWEVSSFSYEEYTAEYSEEIVESYESSETLIEETVTSEEFASEMSEESFEETEEVAEETSEEEIEEGSEDEFSEESGDEMASEEEATDEEDLAEEEVSEEDMGEEEFAEEEPEGEVVDEVDEEAEDESYDEPEDSGNEGGDEGGDEG